MSHIIQRPLAELATNPRNARTHSQKQIAQIAASIKSFGFINPVLIDDAGMILAGHGRVAAAKSAGLAKVPTLQVDHLTMAQKRAYALADNKIALNAGWDLEMLQLDLQELALLDLNFDIEITGFETGEIDVLIGATPAKQDRADIMPAVADRAVSQDGDVWMLGDHRLGCGDARKSEAFIDVMAGDRARMVFTDPPYNVPIDGHVSGNGAVKHREFVEAAGEMSRDQFVAFLSEIFVNMANLSNDGAIHFICMDWRHMTEVQDAAKGIYSELKNLCVWNKTNAGMGSFYRSKHELVFVYKVGRGAHLNTVELGKNGRYRTNVWDYAGANSFGSAREAELQMHPTVKPVAMVMDAIKDCSRRGDIVLDPCAGSGTTLIAAEKTGRVARALEIDPLYADTIVRRWQTLTGKSAVLATTGAKFDEMVAAER